MTFCIAERAGGARSVQTERPPGNKMQKSNGKRCERKCNCEVGQVSGDLPRDVACFPTFLHRAIPRPCGVVRKEVRSVSVLTDAIFSASSRKC